MQCNSSIAMRMRHEHAGHERYIRDFYMHLILVDNSHSGKAANFNLNRRICSHTSPETALMQSAMPNDALAKSDLKKSAISHSPHMLTSKAMRGVAHLELFVHSMDHAASNTR